VSHRRVSCHVRSPHPKFGLTAAGPYSIPIARSEFQARSRDRTVIFLFDVQHDMMRNATDFGSVAAPCHAIGSPDHDLRSAPLKILGPARHDNVGLRSHPPIFKSRHAETKHIYHQVNNVCKVWRINIQSMCVPARLGILPGVPHGIWGLMRNVHQTLVGRCGFCTTECSCDGIRAHPR
jgi:hypothetical protein